MMKKKRSDSIANSLEEMVFTGQFQDGERLDETLVAKRFGVSRTPVREALKRLVSSRLAEQRPRRGVFVKQPASITIVEVFETMAEIEAVCGRCAAQRVTQMALENHTVANTRCMAAIAENDAEANSHHNESFHRMTYRLSGNDLLAEQALRLCNHLRPYRRVEFLVNGRTTQSMSEHKSLIAALTAGKPDDAAVILRDHVGAQGERFYQEIAKLRRSVANRNVS